MRLLAAAILLAVSAAPAAAQQSIGTADLATVSKRGAQLYAFDQAAWHSTDAMLAKGLLGETMQAIRGWVVEPSEDLLRVTYYGFEGTTPYAIYIADIRDGKVVSDRVPGPDGRALSARGARMAAAASVARTQSFPRCVDRPFNTVILPPQPDGTVPVYLLTPMTKAGEYPFGGHHEVDVGPDGTVVGTRDFSRACLPMQAPSDTAMLFITHLLDPHPTELHVYLSLWSGKAVAVGTSGDRIWEVSGTRIAPMEGKPQVK
jgi:hypothetical protein